MSRTLKLNLDDDVLVEHCRRGSSVAMERLIVKYQNRLYNVILKICGNKDDAAELTQDTFVKIIQNIDKFQGRSSFYTWAFRIGVNLTLNYCKRKAWIGYKSIDNSALGNSGTAKRALKNFLKDETFSDPAKKASDKELTNLVVKAIMKLDSASRAVVVLRDIEGMDYRKIAETLGIKLGTVKSRLSRARESLREILEAASK